MPHRRSLILVWIFFTAWWYRLQPCRGFTALSPRLASSGSSCHHLFALDPLQQQLPSQKNRRSSLSSLSQKSEEQQGVRRSHSPVDAVANVAKSNSNSTHYLLDDVNKTTTLPSSTTESSSPQKQQQFNNWKIPTISIEDLVYTPQTELLSGILVLLSCSLTAISTLPKLPPLFFQVLVEWQEGIAFFLFLEFLAEWWYALLVSDQPDVDNIFLKQQQKQQYANGQSELTDSSFATTSPVGGRSVTTKNFWAKQWSYFTKPLVLIDVVVVVLPVLLPHIPDTWFPDEVIGIDRLFDEEVAGVAGSGLITLRMLRLLRWQRVLQDLATFQNFQSALLGVPSSSVTPIRPYQLQLARVLVSIVTLLSVSAGLIYTTERQVNPNLSDFFSALYFTLTTLTTVGFGDITPMTPQGKMVVSASILAGIAILPAQAASLVDALMKGNNNHDNESDGVTTTSTTIVEQQSYVNGVRNGYNNGATTTTTAPTTVVEETTVDTTGKVAPNVMSMRELELPKLDLTTRCDTCGATSHWSRAKFCWTCGSRL